MLITNATQYTGPGAVKTLHDQGARVICHDRSFGDKRVVSDFMTAYPRAIGLGESDPEGIVSELTQEFGTVDAVVSNDSYPITRARFIDDEAGQRIIADTLPAGRLGTPEEVGELIAFLVSEKCKFVTGQVIYFTGGWP